MERKAYLSSSRVGLIVVTVAFLSAMFTANATLSEAASGKKKSDTNVTAVQQTESRIKQLKSALNITEEQETLWSNMTRAMRENANAMDLLTKERAESATTMNAVERMKLHSQLTEAQLAQQKKFIPPFEALYNSMSDSQKAATDAIFRTGKHGKHKIQ